MRLNLSEVTICAIDCVTPRLAADAISISTQNIEFGDAILLSDQIIDGPFNGVQIERLNSRNDYSRFIIESLLSYISTEYVLIVQWDGFVTSKNSWQNKFLDYDYIGARWPWHNDGFSVGNGGFSLRSKRLMKEALVDLVGVDYSLNEDELICRVLRSSLEGRGIKFASDEIADQFSYERTSPEGETFGFHGLFNMWRHCDDSKMLDLFPYLSGGTYASIEYLELMIVYLKQKKFHLYKKMYQLLQHSLNSSDIRQHFAKYVDDAVFIDYLISVGQ